MKSPAEINRISSVSSSGEVVYLSQSIKDSISTEKVMNEVHLEESVMEREEECEWDMKWALDHSPLYR